MLFANVYVASGAVFVFISLSIKYLISDALERIGRASEANSVPSVLQRLADVFRSSTSSNWLSLVYFGVLIAKSEISLSFVL